MTISAEDKIFDLFEVSREEAALYAAEFAEVVKAHGGVVNAEVIEGQVPKIFGSRLTWRREADRSKIMKRSTATVTAYNAFISTRRR